MSGRVDDLTIASYGGNGTEPDDVDDLRERLLGHLTDGTDERERLERLAVRDDVGDLDAVARLVLALADGERPDEADIETLLGFGNGGDA